MIRMKAYKNLLVVGVFCCTLFVACSPKVWQVFVSGPEAVYLSPIDKAPLNPCKQSINYAPSIEYPNHTPMRYVRVRFMVVQAVKDDPNTLLPHEAPAYIKRLIEIVNYKLSITEQMKLPIGNNTPAIPRNYRFLLYLDPTEPNDIGVDYAVDSSLAYFNRSSNISGSYDRRAYDKYAKYKGQVLTVVLQEHHPDSITSKTYNDNSTGTGFPDWFKIAGAKQNYDTIWHADGTFETTGYAADLFVHETGHSFGLMHTWSGNDGCDDTPNHPNCWDANSGPCKHDGIYSNNMMDYNNNKSALTPCQLGIVNYNFSRDGSPQRKYLEPMWCEYKKDSIINIYTDVEWNGSKDLEGDIIIQNGGRLTIRCRVSLPAGARIIIKPRGTLVLDGAHLTNLCNQQWEGIEQWGNSKEQGSLVLYSASTIDKVLHEVALPSR